ncbi:MAG: MBL fold metallo-hydrolase [Methanobacteriaceae archaeon]
MIFRMIKSKGIAHHSYFLGAGGKAAVIDPRRDVEVYLDLALENDLQISYIFETHRNEDYVIGSLELQKAVGGEIYHGANFDFGYGNPVHENDKFRLGSLELEVLETPGHTKESISLVLRDLSVSSVAQMVFTGDVIFAGETGRIDFYGIPHRPLMSELLYDSIFTRILPLGEHVILCPAHGAGSVCGTDIREHDHPTVGYEKKTNPQLHLNKEDFIRQKSEEELYYPPYFRKMEEINQAGPPVLGRMPPLRPITPSNLKELQEDGFQILDIRQPTSFAGGHIKGSLNIWMDGVPSFAGWFLNYQDPLIIIADPGTSLEELKKLMVRLGYDNLYGYLSGGFPSWYLQARTVETLKLHTVQQIRERQFDGDFFLLDVRKLVDRKEGFIEGSKHIYAGLVPQRLAEIPKDQEIVLYCDSGNKSTMVASYLLQEGYQQVGSVLGSMKAWMKASYPVVQNNKDQ